MRSFFKLFVIGVLSVSAASVFARDDVQQSEATPAPKCEHGVKRSICTRCNPKLKAVFKAKGDWCEEHERAESQCAICHPELQKDGVKP